ncbi:MAG: hypothetical protein QF489_05630, partial [Planctomycetota bacterium]|nr:hypothetical protein [Planctomycetota bacterium]
MARRLPGRRRMGAGVTAETPANTVLPLLELAASEVGLAGAMHFGAELEAQGYFEAGLLAQWQMIHDLLWERLAIQKNNANSIRALAHYPEPKIRFYVPGIWARWGKNKPQAALEAIQGLAADEDFRVLESSQAFGVRPF